MIALFLPGAIALLANQLRIQFQGTKANRTFLTLAYGYLPLLLFASLAHYLQMGLTEAGQIIPVFAATFNLTSSLASSLTDSLADSLIVPAIAFSAHPAVIAFLQGTALIFGALLSLLLTQKISRQPLRQLLPQHGATLVFTLLFWQLIL